MEPTGSLLCLQEPATEPYPEPSPKPCVIFHNMLDSPWLIILYFCNYIPYMEDNSSIHGLEYVIQWWQGTHLTGITDVLVNILIHV